MMTTKQQSLRIRHDILFFLAKSPSPTTTAAISKALNISLYTARYHLRQLVAAGAAQEINNGKGSSSCWLSLQ
ncbi:FaeA/PapI family transcriptional regulator [Aeromonas allosaccharophila]|uniref:FaeA/PapI family transcriptional regulator n=1 Tax=Aeromonas allosaccharophila TaxID=656 RepID=UPI002ADEFEC3|nr:FaeA/PapI family transcriptional regulator [Aeromonas allosaccharophila]